MINKSKTSALWKDLKLKHHQDKLMKLIWFFVDQLIKIMNVPNTKTYKFDKLEIYPFLINTI